MAGRGGMDECMSGIIPILTAVIAFAVTSLLGIWIVPFLKKLKFGQTILDIGPKWHKEKEGTPTIGGVMFIVGTVSAVVIAYLFVGVAQVDVFVEGMKNSFLMTKIWAGILLAAGMSLIGFMDDYIKVVKKRNLGLTARQKTFFQLAVAAGYLIALALGGLGSTWIPFVGMVDVTSGAGLLFWPVALLFIYGFVNAVNLTDGVDGLASAVTMLVSAFFLLMAGVLEQYAGVSIVTAAMAGGCVGFLIWNMHPAKVFMGDTGSMFLGGMAVSFAFAIDRPVLLIFAGILYLIEALSVVLQVMYYKRTKKRLFKMSPLHHHFEMCGWKEEKIVLVFSIVTVIGCIIGALLVFYIP